MKNPDWEARVERANELINDFPASAQLLRFYARLAAFQRAIYDAVSRWNTLDTERPLRSQIEADLVVPFFPELLAMSQEHGPAKLAEAAKRLHEAGERGWREAILDYVATVEQEDASHRFFVRACVEPYAEHLASQLPIPQSATGTCPLCAAKPGMAVLRPEGEGAKKSLVCSFCLAEWEFRRILCPVCGEESDPHLPVFTAQEFPYFRVEGCDTCKHYLLSVDLSKNGHAIPLVDEIAAAPLDFWARQQGFEKVVPNLLGV